MVDCEEREQLAGEVSRDPLPAKHFENTSQILTVEVTAISGMAPLAMPQLFDVAVVRQYRPRRRISYFGRQSICLSTT